MKVNRRMIIVGTAAGGAALALGMIPVLIDGRTEHVSPGEARHRDVPLRTLTLDDAAILDRLGEALLPGAAEAGFVHYIDHHVSVPAAESFLIARYLDVPPPYADFYRSGLAALDAHSVAAHKQRFTDLSLATARGLVASLMAAPLSNWRGPPAPLFYFVTRADALDVMYGTMAGFEQLGVPYMAHIDPERPW